MNDRQLIADTEAVLKKIKDTVEYIPTWIRAELAKLHGQHAAQLGTDPNPAPPVAPTPPPPATTSGPPTPVQPVAPPPPPPATVTATLADDYWEGHTLFEVHRKHSDATFVGDWRHPGNVVPDDELTKAIQQEAATIFFQQMQNATLTLADAFLISAVDLGAFNSGSDSAPEWNEAACDQAKREIAAAQAVAVYVVS